ncbi:MAG: hypothetical protein LBE38_03575 [Deltaproteobacteria bacterium]|nr:hypothetical protein [Deltaproteobacteria bacterium]
MNLDLDKIAEITDKADKEENQEPSTPLSMMLFLGIVLLVGLFIAVKVVAEESFIFVAIFIAICAIPIALVSSYFDAIRLTTIADRLTPEGFAIKFLSYRFFFHVLLFAVSLILSSILVINLASLSLTEWIYVLISFPVFLCTLAFIKARMKKEAALWLVNPWSLQVARRLAPLFMVLIYWVGLIYSGVHLFPETLGEAQSTNISPFTGTESYLLGFLGEWIQTLGGIRNYAYGRILGLGALPFLLFLFLSSYAVFYSLCSFYSFMFIPRKELRRVVAKPVGSKAELPLPFVRFVIQMLVPMVICLAVFFHFAVVSELFFMRYNAPLQLANRAAKEELYRLVVLIDNEAYYPEIIAAASSNNLAMQLLMQETKQELLAATDAIFDGYVANVDTYLDWYYSLEAEYARLGTLTVGKVEEFMAQSLLTHINQGVSSSGLVNALNSFNQKAQKFNLDNLIARYAVDIDAEGPNVKNIPIIQMSSGIFRETFTPPSFTSLEVRVGTSSGVGLLAGLVTGVAAKRIVGTIASRLIFQTAAKTLLKTAVGKGVTYTSSMAVGGGAGAGIGSVVPGIGTAIGAVVGVVVGLGTAVIVDKTLLALEEAINRENFKRSLVDSIEQQRREVKAMIEDSFGSPGKVSLNEA